MKNKIFIFLSLALVGVTGTIFVVAKFRPISSQQAVKPLSHWTCSMHPQVHQDGPGNCPICGMPLIQVTDNSQSQGPADQQSTQEIRSTVSGSENDWQLAQIHPIKVQMHPIQVQIPIAGRFIDAQHLAFQIFEQDLGLIKRGDSLSITPTAAQGQILSGKITAIDSTLDPTTRTLRVSAQLDRPFSSNISELTFSGTILINKGERLAIDEDSIVHTGHGDLVYLYVGNEQLQAQTVALGAKAGHLVEVLSGLSAGDTISSGPNFLIDSEAKIRGAND